MKKKDVSVTNENSNDLMLNYYNTIVQTKSYEIKYDWTMPFKKNSSTSSSGSGFFIDNDGHILTCAHCVENANKCYVIIPNEGRKEHEAIIKGVCPFFDIALIQIKDYKNKQYCELEKDDSEIVSGVETYALGFPLGQDNLKITRGIISGQQLNYYQTDTSINPGNSGGPLFNMNGEVIGIASYIKTQSGGSNGLGFTVTSNSVKNLLLERAHFWSGMDVIPLSPEISKAFQLPQKVGALIQKVAGGSPAEKVGFKGGTLNAQIGNTSLILGGDIILSVNGIYFNTHRDVENMMESIKNFKKEDILVFEIWRDGQRKKLTLAATK